MAYKSKLLNYVSAQLNTTEAGATGDGTAHTIIFNNVSVGTNNIYDDTTGIFTIPSTSSGLYQVNVNLCISGLVIANTNLEMYLATDDVLNPIQQTFCKLQPFPIATTTGEYCASFSITDYLNAGVGYSVVLVVSGNATKNIDVVGSLSYPWATSLAVINQDYNP